MRKFVLLALLCLGGLLSFGQKVEKGKASFYADKFVGRQTANGEIFTNSGLTAAHKKLPFNTMVEVTNISNNKKITVRINDRGPFVRGRIIDLTSYGAKLLGYHADGITDVELRIVGSSKTNPSPAPVASKKSGPKVSIFKVNTTKVATKGYGVQVANLQNSANLLRFCNNIESKTNEQYFVMVKESKGVSSYHICVGHYTSKKQAKKLCNQLKRTFSGCFVVNYL